MHKSFEERWFSKRRIIPVKVGEFQEDVLREPSGRLGVEIFPTPFVIKHEIRDEREAAAIGQEEDL